MVLSMDEIINAICIHNAERTGFRPTDVQVELCWDEDTGYTGEVTVNGRSIQIAEANIVEAVIQYLFKQYDMRAFRDDVRLELEDEIIAIVSA